MLITRQNVLSSPVIQSAKLLMLFSNFNPIAYKQYLSGLCRSERFDFYSDISPTQVTLRYKGSRFGLAELSIAKARVYGNGSKMLLDSELVSYRFESGENIWCIQLPESILLPESAILNKHYVVHASSNLEQLSEKIIADILKYSGTCPIQAKEVVYNSIYYAYERPYNMPLRQVIVNGVRYALNPDQPKHHL